MSKGVLNDPVGPSRRSWCRQFIRRVPGVSSSSVVAARFVNERFLNQGEGPVQGRTHRDHPWVPGRQKVPPQGARRGDGAKQCVPRPVRSPAALMGRTPAKAPDATAFATKGRELSSTCTFNRVPALETICSSS